MNTTELSHTIGLQSIPIDKYNTLLGGDKLRKKKDILFNNFGIIAFGLSKKSFLFLPSHFLPTWHNRFGHRT